MSQIEQRFNAAVNVIRGLPKSGSYQPSNDMMLRFYSYFKQATLGPCTQKKPPFWDIVGRAKYDSYRRLGNMSKDRAMELYVDELKKIIESMSHTDNTSDMMGNVNELNGIDLGDLEAVAPEAMKKIISHPNSPFASREASPIRVSTHENGYANGNEQNSTNGHNHSDQNYHSGHTTEHSDDEYIDTVDDDTDLIAESIASTHISRSLTRRSVGNSFGQLTNAVTNGVGMNATNYQHIEPAIDQILRTVELMNNDLQQINRRIDTIERLMATMDNYRLKSMNPRWWPFTDISPTWFLFMLLWPYVAQRLGKMLRNKK